MARATSLQHFAACASNHCGSRSKSQSGQGKSFPLADKLLAEDVPIIFATAYDASSIPARFADAPMLEGVFRRVFAEASPAARHRGIDADGEGAS
jgi:hypothetical protein